MVGLVFVDAFIFWGQIQLVIRNDAADYSFGIWLFLCLQNISSNSTRYVNCRRNLFKLSFSPCGVFEFRGSKWPWRILRLSGCLLFIKPSLSFYIKNDWPWLRFLVLFISSATIGNTPLSYFHETLLLKWIVFTVFHVGLINLFSGSFDGCSGSICCLWIPFLFVTSFMSCQLNGDPLTDIYFFGLLYAS